MTAWTGDTVKAALVEAFEIDNVIGGPVGPRMYGSGMPAYLTTNTDYNELVDIHEAAGKYWGEQADDRRKKIRHKRIASIEQIRHMEIVLLGHTDEHGFTHPMWLGGFLPGNNGPRNCLEAYAVHSARALRHGRRFNESRFCRRIGWNYETYKSRRDRGAEIIAFKLNQLGIPCWFQFERELGEKPKAPPVAEVLLIYIGEKPRTRAQCISYAFTEGLIASRENAHAIKIALKRLLSQNRIAQTQDGRFALAG